MEIFNSLFRNKDIFINYEVIAMKVFENQITTKDKYVQIYLSKQEYEDNNIQKQIEQYNQNNNKVAIFINGNRNYLSIIKQIINVEVENQKETRYTTINMKNKQNGISQGEKL